MASLRLAGLCGLVAFATFNVGWIAGDLAQPAAFSPANDDISDLGAMTPGSPWLYNRAANLSNLVFSPLGAGAATRAGTVVVFASIAFIGFRLQAHAARPASPSAPPGSGRTS